MKPIAIACASLVTLLGACSGGPQCTTEPRSAWMSEDAMKSRVASLGYRVNEFKISGNCYEIYGWDREGRKAEVYFNPVNGEIVKSEIH